MFGLKLTVDKNREWMIQIGNSPFAASIQSRSSDQLDSSTTLSLLHSVDISAVINTSRCYGERNLCTWFHRKSTYSKPGKNICTGTNTEANDRFQAAMIKIVPSTNITYFLFVTIRYIPIIHEDRMNSLCQLIHCWILVSKKNNFSFDNHFK